MTVRDRKVVILHTYNNNASLRHHENGLYRPFCLADDIYRIIIIDGEDFYILPPEVLAQRGFIGSNESEGVSSVGINKNNASWLKRFKNDVTWLRRLYIRPSAT